MLRTIGVDSIDGLFADIPEAHRNPELKLPPPLSELELRRELTSLAEINLPTSSHACFLGAGAYHHFIPSVVQSVISRGEYLTSYTPYQAEASQGTLQTTYEFQSLVCQLLGMEVANAGMYDGATSLAEAALMACRLTRRDRIAVLDTVSPTYREVLRTYTEAQGIQVSVVSPKDRTLDENTAALLVQHPNFYGYLEDLSHLGQAAHDAGALFVVSTDPIAAGMFPPPSEYGADIVTAEGQPLGVPLSFGGPYVGLFTTRMEYLRQMPGRIVGRTQDDRGRTGYVLTLQAREQHIRRERATSNICTSQALVALAATVYLACMGPRGLRHVAELCYHKAHYTASSIARIPGYSLPIEGTFFQEFVVRCPVSPAEINKHLLEKGMIGGLDVSETMPNGLLLCVTEMNTRQEIDTLVAALGEVAS
jgi:glycine dehydrogenase subunit 1